MKSIVISIALAVFLLFGCSQSNIGDQAPISPPAVIEEPIEDMQDPAAEMPAEYKASLHIADEFNDDYYFSTTKQGSDKVDITVLRDGSIQGNTMIKVSASSPSKNIIDIFRETPQGLDWSGYEYVSFWMKGDGNPGELQFVITEMDGERWHAFFGEQMSHDIWHEVNIRISEMKQPEWTVKTDGVMDTSNIKRIGFFIPSEPVAGTPREVYLDNLYLTRSQEWIDVFSEVDYYFSTLEDEMNKITAVSDKDDWMEHDSSMKVTYNIKDKGVLDLLRETPQGTDMSGFDMVSFWVKGDGQKMNIQFVLDETDGDRWYYDAGDLGSNEQWHHVLLKTEELYQPDYSPKSDSILDMGSILRYGFILNTGDRSMPASGSMNIDKLMLLN